MTHVSFMLRLRDASMLTTCSRQGADQTAVHHQRAIGATWLCMSISILINVQDIILVHDIWVAADLAALQDACRTTLPHMHHFTCGMLGSNVAVFARWPIMQVWAATTTGACTPQHTGPDAAVSIARQPLAHAVP